MTPQTTARQQAAHIIETAKAYLDGKPIRVRKKRPRGEWEDINPDEEAPSWDFDAYEYEVKPEERKPMRGVMWKHPNLTHLCAHHGCSADHVAELNGWELVTVMEVLPETETE